MHKVSCSMGYNSLRTLAGRPGGLVVTLECYLKLVLWF